MRTTEAFLRVDEDSARSICLVRAVEELDRRGSLLRLDTRRAASAEVDGDPSDWIPERSRTLADRLEDEHRELGAGVARLGPGLRWALPVAVFAVASGLGTQALGTGREVHVLAPPLLALLLWNVTVLVLGLGVRLVGASALSRGPLDRWLDGLRSKRLAGQKPAAPLADRIRRRFLKLWFLAAAPLAKARVQRLLHLSALCLVAGVVAGMYIRGLVLDYRVTWESTFLGGETVDRLAGFVLGPAAFVLGTDVPSTIELQRPASGPAAPWIHLWAVTALLFVGLPRGVLFLEAAWRAERLARRLRVEVPRDWVARIRLAATGAALRVIVRPYSFEPTDAAWSHLRELVFDLAGPRSDLTRRRSLTYGDDAPTAEGDLEILLFPLAQTPEVEVHAELLSAWRRTRETVATGASLAVVVDASSFRRRVGSEEVEVRVAERQRAWSRVIAESGFEALHLDLEESTSGDQAERLRARVWPEGSL